MYCRVVLGGDVSIVSDLLGGSVVMRSKRFAMLCLGKC